ncbi:MAG TPA: hypothetical protein VEP30_05535 [Chthoniobacterales bacterium]|nr:hypothetical protein [Chthoniobacterales bacterium]
MKTIQPNRFLKTALLIACSAFIGSQAWATLVTWNLNPSGLNQAVGSSSQSYTVSGYSITASGYDNNGGVGTLHDLFFKNDGGDEIGLGLVNTLHNELQVGSNGPLNFIQLDLTSILAAGFTNGQIQVGSLQTNESFSLFGSNTLGSLGVQLNGSPYGSAFDLQFVSIPNFGTYKFISIVASALDCLPVAFQATIVPVPEATSLMPVICLVIAATALEARRRRCATA